jgi:hypothetical protein
MTEWKLPEQFDIPGELGHPVMLKVDYGNGECETRGKAFLLPEGSVVFSDHGTWATQYVKAWRRINNEKQGE